MCQGPEGTTSLTASALPGAASPCLPCLPSHCQPCLPSLTPWLSPCLPISCQPCQPSLTACLSPCLADAQGWSCPGSSGTSPGGQARPCRPLGHHAPSHRGLGRSAVCCSVCVHQTHGTASVSVSSPCGTMLAQTRAPSTSVKASVQTGRGILWKILCSSTRTDTEAL